MINIYKRELDAVLLSGNYSLIKKLIERQQLAEKMSKHTSDFKCRYCEDGIFFTPKQWSLDHFIPRSKGGRRGDNLIFCCKRCNTLKSNLMPHELIELLEYRLDSTATIFYHNNTETPRSAYERILNNVKALIAGEK